jgi:aryl-alcohol dehydrogenase-like predicted oxidoreductase
VPYSPLGRGFLTGKITDRSGFADDDFRRNLPRFQHDAMRKNQQLLSQLRDVADKYRCTLAQLALAWVMSKGDDIVPIPGRAKSRICRIMPAQPAWLFPMLILNSSIASLPLTIFTD